MFKSTAEEVSFEWSHHRILLIDSNVRPTLHVSLIDSQSKGLKNIHEKLFTQLHIRCMEKFQYKLTPVT